VAPADDLLAADGVDHQADLHPGLGLLEEQAEEAAPEDVVVVDEVGDVDGLLGALDEGPAQGPGLDVVGHQAHPGLVRRSGGEQPLEELGGLAGRGLRSSGQGGILDEAHPLQGGRSGPEAEGQREEGEQ
jgi:hypothetical protein